MKKIMVKFPKKKKVGKRDWGQEILCALIPKKISLKILKIKKGKKGGLQYHRKKDECGIIISGKLLVRYENSKGKLSKRILKKGDIFHFPPGSIHQEEAITNCEMIESYTHHFNYRVRVEKKFGINFSKGLKTTKINEILFR